MRFNYSKNMGEMGERSPKTSWKNTKKGVEKTLIGHKAFMRFWRSKKAVRIVAFWRCLMSQKTRINARERTGKYWAKCKENTLFSHCSG
jgi:GT2 family glycosyltransferase